MSQPLFSGSKIESTIKKHIPNFRIRPQYTITIICSDTYLTGHREETNIHVQTSLAMSAFPGSSYVVVKNIIPEAPKRILNYVYDDPKDFDKEGYRV